MVVGMTPFQCVYDCLYQRRIKGVTVNYHIIFINACSDTNMCAQ
jgi:hypothetical protein